MVNILLDFEPDKRIVGGSNAHKGEWPWQVAITENGVGFCGGSLIFQLNEFAILTAAHCVHGKYVCVHCMIKYIIV